MRPIFVVGMNGSGTSMLTESMGRHPQLYAFPGETRMIPHYIDQQSRFGGLDGDENFRRFWEYVIASAPDFEVFNGGKPLSVPENWREFPRNLAAILDAVFRQFALDSGIERWVEKSPNNTERLLDIGRLFPDARFIHIIRDGRDCAASIRRRQYRNPELTIYRWRQIVVDAREQGRSLGHRYFEMRYEDLTEEPEYWMREVCRFIDLQFFPCVLESSMPQSEKKRSGNDMIDGAIEPNSGKYLKHFREQEIKKLENIAGKLLNELHYHIQFEAGDNDVAWTKAHVIRFLDFLKANRRLREKLTGKQSGSWRDVLRSSLASVREYSSKKY